MDKITEFYIAAKNELQWSIGEAFGLKDGVYDIQGPDALLDTEMLRYVKKAKLDISDEKKVAVESAFEQFKTAYLLITTSSREFEALREQYGETQNLKSTNNHDKDKIIIRTLVQKKDNGLNYNACEKVNEARKASTKEELIEADRFSIIGDRAMALKDLEAVVRNPHCIEQFKAEKAAKEIVQCNNELREFEKMVKNGTYEPLREIFDLSAGRKSIQDYSR
jgi:hypothetical protein